MFDEKEQNRETIYMYDHLPETAQDMILNTIKVNVVARSRFSITIAQFERKNKYIKSTSVCLQKVQK